MIKIDEMGYVEHEKLSEQEARMFVGFLLQEETRHKLDINNIRATVGYLKQKFNFI